MLKLFGSLLLVGIIVPLGFVGGMNYRGYCWDEERILSDQELINRLIEVKYLNWPYISDSRMKREVKKKTSETFSSRLPYQSVKKFHEENRNCCLIRGDGRSESLSSITNINFSYIDPSLWLRLTGRVRANIGDKHKIRFLNHENEVRFLETDGSFWVTACGEPTQAPVEYWGG